jgi:hypothetical protein
MLQRPEPRKFLYQPCSLIASDQEIKALSNKRTTMGCSYNSTGGSVIKLLWHLAHQEGGLVFFWKRCFYYPMSSSPRWHSGLTAWGSRSLPFSNSFTFSVLPCGFTPTGEFVLRQLLNHDGMNKLSQLNVFVSFALWVTCRDPFPYMLSKVSIQSIGHASLVLRLA